MLPCCSARSSVSSRYQSQRHPSTIIALSLLVGSPMAVVRPALSRLVVSSSDLGCVGRPQALRGNASRLSSCMWPPDAGSVQCRSNCSHCLSHPLFSGAHLGSAVDRRPFRAMRGAGCLYLRGFRTAASNARKDATSTSHVLRVPSLGESITEGTVVEWRRGVGSVVQAEEVVCVLETDKVSVDIHADMPGRIVSIAVDVGGTVFVGGELALIDPLPPEAISENVCGSSSGKDLPSSGQGLSGPELPATHENVTAASTDSPPRHSFRKPLISFKSERNRRGKLGIQPQQQHGESPKLKVERPTERGPAPKVLRYKGLEDLPPFLERPTLSPEEIVAINDGGLADVDTAAKAWSVSLSFKPPSTGVKAPGTPKTKGSSA